MMNKGEKKICLSMKMPENSAFYDFFRWMTTAEK